MKKNHVRNSDMDEEECDGVGVFEEQKSGIVDEVSVLQRKKEILKAVISKYCFGDIDAAVSAFFYEVVLVHCFVTM